MSAASGPEPLRTREPVDRSESARRRIVEAAADLLARDGRDAFSTRVVAAAAGVQAPAIYRLFGDKDGLLAAVAEHGYDTFLAGKRPVDESLDPVEDLRAGWDLAVDFGLSNPALYVLMYGEPRVRTRSSSFEAGMKILYRRIRRVAAAGRLRLDETLAATVIHATAHGAVLTWLSLPEDQRDPALLASMREAMVAAVTVEAGAFDPPGVGGEARALRAAMTEAGVLTAAERMLLDEWLSRLP